MRILILLVILLTTTIAESAGLELVIPTWSKHVLYEEAKAYSEGFDNRGLGLNLNLEDKLDVGFVYMSSDSVKEQSLYAYAIGYTGTSIKVGGGLAFIIKSKQDPQQKEYVKTQPAAIVPTLAIRYGWLRAATTMPFGKMFGAPMDLITIQLLIPIN